jgi:hypothetical protein
MYYVKHDNIKNGDILQNVLDDNNFINVNTQPDKNKWILYLPCGYTYIETELRKIKDNVKGKYIFGIKGCDLIVSKDKLWIMLVNKYGLEKAASIMPNTYILYDNSDIRRLIKDHYINKIYIMKKNLQRKEGLFITDSITDINNGYGNGYKVAQTYIRNIYLVNRRKINLRVYLLIIVKDGNVIGYVYRNGKCIYTNKVYDDKQFDFESNITSYNVDPNIYNSNPQTFDDLRIYMNAADYNYDILFNNIIINLQHTMAAISYILKATDNIKDATLFQLFGLDFIFTNSLKPYLLEFNKGPDFRYVNEVDKKLKGYIMRDIFNLVGLGNMNISCQNNFIKL